MDHAGPGLNAFGDGGSIVIIAGTLAGILPSVASLLAIIWYGVMLWECRTVRRWREKFKSSSGD